MSVPSSGLIVGHDRRRHQRDERSGEALMESLLNLEHQQVAMAFYPYWGKSV